MNRLVIKFMSLPLAAALTLAILASPQQASANGQLIGYYFMLSQKHPDVNHGIDDAIVTGLVANTLGPHGFPVVTQRGRSFSGASGPIKDVNADGEIMWWSTESKYGVKRDKVSTDTLPFDFPNMYPTGRQDDATYFRTAYWRGSFTTAANQTVGFSLGSDDDSWVFIDNKLVVDNGGVKPMATAPYTIAHLSPGIHSIAIFYADRHPTGASLQLSTGFAVSPPVAQPVSTTRPSLTAAQMREELRTQGRFVVHDIHFAFNKTDITPDSAAILAEVAKVLQSDPTLRLRIEGHTDNIGSEAYNSDLSQRRAESVKTYLVQHFQIDPNRLTTAGFGFSRPIASNDTAQGRAQNRRVEFVKI
jgi:fibro-slime domain-containing protein